jgi:hypothetical protein
MGSFAHHFYTVPRYSAQTPYINMYIILPVSQFQNLPILLVIGWAEFFCQVHRTVTVPFLSIFLLLFKWWSSFGFLHDVVDKHTDVSEERTASIFRINELVKVDYELIQWKKCVSFVGSVQGVKAVTAAEGGKRWCDCPESMRVTISKIGPFVPVSPVGFVEVMWAVPVLSYTERG